MSMKQSLSIFLMIPATPALAHHEVVVATSVVPLAATFAGISMAAFLAWRRARKK